MLYLHMSIPSVRMMDTYTRMIRRNFPLDEHRFAYMDDLSGGDRALLDYGNSVAITGSSKERLKQIREEMDKADVIIWHGIMFGAKRALIPLIFKQYMHKSVWIMRGIDLYNWRKEGKGLKVWITNKVNYLCRKGMPYVATIFPTDGDVYRQQFGEQAKIFSVSYPMAESAFEIMEKYRGTGQRPNGKLYVQVAHNAYAFNNHLDILEQIKDFKNENLRVIVPLSYGNDWYNQVGDYIKTVKNRTLGYFGTKATILKRLMPPDEYSELLCNIDVSIYGSARQNALGNILRSLYIGNKVYLSNQNPLYEFFREHNIEVFEMESIRELGFEEFSRPSDSVNAVDWIRRTYYPDSSAVCWKSMFEYFRDDRREEMTEEEITEQVNAVLNRDFSRETAQQRVKTNYVNLTRYVEHPKGTNLPQMKNVVILGADVLGMRLFGALTQSNKSGTKWSIDGFADYRIKTLDNPNLVCDVLGTPDEIEIMPETLYFNTIYSVEQRRRAAEHVLEGNGILQNFIGKNSTVNARVTFGGGCLLLDKCIVLESASIGRCSILKSAFIDYGAQIGAYCTLERGCWIGEGAMIEDGVVIGPQTKIAPGVRISKGTVVPAFSIINEDIK